MAVTFVLNVGLVALTVHVGYSGKQQEHAKEKARVKTDA